MSVTFMQKIKQINRDLQNGKIPEELDFWREIEPSQSLDDQVIENMKYLAFYKDFNYYAKRFPHYESLAGFDRVIESIREKNANKTPLDEMRERKSQSNIEEEEYDESNISNTFNE